MQQGWYGCQETDEPSTAGLQVICLWPTFHMQLLCVDSCLQRSQRCFLFKLQLVVCGLVASCLHQSQQTGSFFIKQSINTQLFLNNLKYLELIIVRIHRFLALSILQQLNYQQRTVFKYAPVHDYPCISFDPEPSINWKSHSFMCI